MSKVITTQLNMIDETTKHNRAKGYYRRIALAGDTTGAFNQLVAFNQEADNLKNLINKKFGPGTMKYGSEISPPPTRPEVIEMDAINAFMKRNPAAEGGQMVQPSVDGSRPGYSGKGYHWREDRGAWRIFLKRGDEKISKFVYPKDFGGSKKKAEESVIVVPLID